VVAIEVSLSLVAGVTDCGSPVRTGDAMFALRSTTHERVLTLPERVAMLPVAVARLVVRVVSALILLVISVARLPERVAILPVAVAMFELMLTI
jgi:hypothetical protein